MVPYDFNPSISHPLYWIRKGLYNKINLYSGELSGRLLDFGCGAKPYQSLFTKVTEYVGVDYAGEGHDHSNESIDVFNPSFCRIELFLHLNGLVVCKLLSSFCKSQPRQRSYKAVILGKPFF